MSKYNIALLLTTTFMAVRAQNDGGPSLENRTEYTYGFIHIEDSTQNIPPVYNGAGNFSDGLVPVKKAGKWGFVDARNREVITPRYDYARNFSRAQAIVQLGEFYGVINPKGELVIPPRYYDLGPYELEGRRYYISRDRTFFAGIIDENGNEVLPHKYTYVMKLEGFVSMGSPRLYKHIPFYTTYREIDTTKGSFYEQFTENTFEFSPESGRQAIYDTLFNPLASRNATSYDDGFSGDELTRVDAYLEGHKTTDIEEKRKAIHQLLDAPTTDTTTSTSDPVSPAPEGLPKSEEEFNTYMARMGYEKFSGGDGKAGVKKNGKIILPARFDLVKWWGTALFSPPEAELAYLKEHFAYTYAGSEKEVFIVFGIAAGDREKGALYTMDGKEVFDITHRRQEKATTAGLIYRTIERDTAEDRTVYRFGFVNWKGQDVLPPNYTCIQLLAGNCMLTKREKETTRGTEEHVGLYSASGEALISEGVFSAIEPISEAPDLFLSECVDTYPTKAEQKERETKNKHFVLLNVSGDTYSVVQRFTASRVYTRWLDPEIGLLKYRKNVKKAEK